MECAIWTEGRGEERQSDGWVSIYHPYSAHIYHHVSHTLDTSLAMEHIPLTILLICLYRVVVSTIR